MNLKNKHCEPCNKGTPSLDTAVQSTLLEELGGNWNIVDHHHLKKEFTFPDFQHALAFTNKVGQVAEQEGHHPDIHLSWGKVTITLWTHKIDNLTENDFICAAKIDSIPESLFIARACY